MEIRALGPGDEQAVVEAGAVFDDPPTEALAAAFLGRQGHHLLVAYVDGAAAGFVSGVEMAHPDKGTEMFLYELGVQEEYRGRGIARALVEALREAARECGCYGMWVLTDADNQAALRTYQGAGASAPSPQVLLNWDIRG